MSIHIDHMHVLAETQANRPTDATASCKVPSLADEVKDPVKATSMVGANLASTSEVSAVPNPRMAPGCSPLE